MFTNLQRCLPRGPRRTTVGILVAAATLTGCASHASKMELFSASWEVGDFVGADLAIDEVIAKESGTPVEVVTQSNGLAEEINPNKGDTSLFLMEKAMTRLALDDTDATIDLLRRSRDVLDPRHTSRSVTDFLKAVAVDDAVIDFSGADYEHIVLRTILTIADLMEGGADAFAYAIQIDEKQEEILGSDFGSGLTDEDGEDVSYKPQEQYQRLPIGTYLVGLVLESRFDMSEASKAYSRADEWAGGSPLIQTAYSESIGETRIEPGSGLVNVFYFGGRGPKLVAGRSDVSDTALLLAKVGVAIIEASVGPLAQTPVEVPIVQILDPIVPPLEIRSGSEFSATEMLLDVNTIAEQQREANMPWFVARAVLRRAFKAGVAAIAANQVDNEVASQLVSLFGNLALTAGERTDTRCWTTLPAQLQVARLRLPEGNHLIDLSEAGSTMIRVRAGRVSHIVVMRTDLLAPAIVRVDKFSRVEPAPEELAEQMPEALVDEAMVDEDMDASVAP